MTKLKVLLIEDNLEVRENTAEILELSNYTVITAENGKIGVEKAKIELPDIILCDIMMPELDGYGVLYMLGKDAKTASIPFVFLTAKTDKSDFRKGMSLGADDYLTKPFEELELLNAIETRLGKHAIFKKEFSKDISGLNDFMNTAKSLEDLNELSKDQKVIKYKKKEIIFREGEATNKLYFINKGKVKVYKINNDGKEYITGLFKEGDFLGYMAMLKDKGYNEYAETLEETELAIIPKDDFLALILNNKDISNKFIKMLTNSIDDKESQLLKLAYDTVRMRIADALILLKDRFEKESESEFGISISRDDLAKIAGTAKETTIRALSDFKSEGLIAIDGRNIKILDSEKLKNLEY